MTKATIRLRDHTAGCVTTPRVARLAARRRAWDHLPPFRSRFPLPRHGRGRDLRRLEPVENRARGVRRVDRGAQPAPRSARSRVGFRTSRGMITRRWRSRRWLRPVRLRNGERRQSRRRQAFGQRPALRGRPGRLPLLHHRRLVAHCSSRNCSPIVDARRVRLEANRQGNEYDALAACCPNDHGRPTRAPTAGHGRHAPG